MKHQRFVRTLATLTSLVPLFAFAAPETYQLDPSHTFVLWQVNHLGFSNQVGKITPIDGTLILDPTDPAKGKVTVNVKTANVLSGIIKLDEHLKSSDFFNVSKFPTATFVSNKVETTGKETAKVYGTFTLLGVSKPLMLDVTLMKQGMNPMTNKKTVGFSASGIIKRSDFGMSYALPAVSDEVKIEIGAEATLVGMASS